MTPHIFPQKYKNTSVEAICANWNSDVQTARFYLLGAMHGARAAGNYELADLFSFYHSKLLNLKFGPYGIGSYSPLRNLIDNSPAI
jgi:hypothetical protein